MCLCGFGFFGCILFTDAQVRFLGFLCKSGS
jgi:hypothetical protein